MEKVLQTIEKEIALNESKVKKILETTSLTYKEGQDVSLWINNVSKLKDLDDENKKLDKLKEYINKEFINKETKRRGRPKKQ